MRTVLICHHDSRVDVEGLTRWLASFTDLVGVIVLEEEPSRLYKRVRAEVRRIGPFRFPDVLAMRFYARMKLAGAYAEWEADQLEALSESYPQFDSPPVLMTHSPNSPESEQFLSDVEPDLMIARCKTLLAERIFTIPRIGTFVLHPGICPEYRNAHGCFWALANDDMDKVGLTLLKIDVGVDTGPVFGYFSYDFDEVLESHLVIQQRVLFENLREIQDRFLEIESGVASPIDISGRPSAVWGQPWLSRFLSWKRAARRRAE